MIIIGYQGIGKSTFAGKHGCIDLESGNFWVDGKRAEDWYIPYCNIAEHLSKQGFTVFTSSHAVVRERLKRSCEDVFIVCPSLGLKDKWIEKLKLRLETTGLEKDYKAYMNAVDRYEDNIRELMECGIEFYSINNMDYDMRVIVDVLHRIARGLNVSWDEVVNDGGFGLDVQYGRYAASVKEALAERDWYREGYRTMNGLIDRLKDNLLGKDYYIADPVCGIQANEIIVDDIIDRYGKKPGLFAKLFHREVEE